MAYKKKLIEVALPLDKINAACAREKSIRHGHPSTLHLWWARRPLAAARAVIWSSLVDDPSVHPEEFPTEEAQNKERQRLFKILEDLVIWENSNDEKVLNAAKAEIMKSTGGNPPALLDPFAGGGSIPLEAQRLGLEAHAHDLNPVAVMINKAMIEIPPVFIGQAPVNPKSRNAMFNGNWQGCFGLAEDVRYYSEWMKREAKKRIGYLYPQVIVPQNQGGGEAEIIAWIWARTVKCPNPACGNTVPLTSSYILSKKANRSAWVCPKVNGKKIEFVVETGAKLPKIQESKKGKGARFYCPACGSLTEDSYVKEAGKAGKIGEQMMAIVAEGQKSRVYVTPSLEQELTAEVEINQEPSGSMPNNPRWFSPPAFGMTDYSDLFTNRQMVTLMTLCSLITEAKEQAEKDAISFGLENDHVPLSEKGMGAQAYGEAISVYLTFVLDKIVGYSSSMNIWRADHETFERIFGRQAMAMVWDYAEVNILKNKFFDKQVNNICECLLNLNNSTNRGEAEQFNAQSDCACRNVMVITDPPYYDNIGYADLSDFFYIWMRQGLKEIYPQLFSTLLVPKAEELIATPYRHEGSMEKAKHFFEQGMLSTCQQLYKYAVDDIPVAIFYAYKQSDGGDSVEGNISSGWETMLSAIINAGFAITGTWPMRTEQTAALKAKVNALASSIVLVCRKRPEDAPQTTRRNLINALKRELRPALKKLQESNIAPVDLAQSAIGPGMAVFSKYRQVLEADGSPMTVRSALQVINEEIDLYFNEQVGSMDTASRFCIDLYTQCAYNDIKFGDAEVLANAKGASIPNMAAHGVLYAKAGNVHLIERTELPEKIDTNEQNIWLLTQQLTRAMEKGGIESCAQILFNMHGSNAENAKDLAYRLYTISDRKGWTNEAYAYNALVVAWPDIQSRAAELQEMNPIQMSMFE